ncbi:GmrSD restriction endonuclease domain-containing protein [Stutzerimonas frequens]|uniref:GmrSD restriction endonuclease domain-containing protein n=1 Tax=Stutzerimonas frequens TaxID=2968969 RepID=UPI0012E10F5E|nr:DUF262 domain-containing protein [Stutzerimonas frequens]
MSQDSLGNLDDEDYSATDLVSKPWNPKDIRITTKTFSIREVYTQILERELDLAPDFQRAFVWRSAQQVKLVESILLGIPLPAFYFNQDNDGNFQVIDGVQRLTTIRHFMSDELELTSDGVDYLKSLSGLRFSTLDGATRRRFGSTQIVAHVIEPQTPDEVKYDIFSRVNTGGSQLSPQEIRHCMSKTTSRTLLKNLVESSSFDEATNWFFWRRDNSGDWYRDNRRMADREMALRFCAFYGEPIAEYALASSLNAFLLDFTRKLDEGRLSSGLKVDDLCAAFDRAMRNCNHILDDHAFRRPAQDGRRGPLNRAVFESQALALADYELSDLLPYKEELRQGFLELFHRINYDGAVRSGTGDYRKVLVRLEEPKSMIKGIVR